MRSPGVHPKKQFPLSGRLLLLVGVSSMMFALTYDFFTARMPNFGMTQLAGLVVGAITALAGLRTMLSLRARTWDGLLVLVYLTGILFMGLRHQHHGLHRSSGMLHNLSFSFSDVTINVLGFIPLGYLMMSYLLSSDRTPKKVPVICLAISACIGVSLLIELSQSYLPGRTSSVVDLMSNGVGATGGVAFCLLEKKHFRDT